MLKTPNVRITPLLIFVTKKKMYDFYIENYEIFLKEINQDLNKWEIILCL